MPGRTVVVLGGGIGGVVAARRLRKRLGWSDRVVLVDRSPSHLFQPSLLWIMSGTRRPSQITGDLRRLRRHGIEVHEAEVLEIDPSAQRVKTSETDLAWDRLVIALGAELAPETFPGFAEAAHNVYTVEGARSAARALRDFRGGRVAVLISRLPYKCPAAPNEAALLADAALRARGLRGVSEVDIYSPEPFPMPTAGQAVGEAILEMLGARGIEFHSGHAAESIDAQAREIVFSNGERAGYDLLLGVPPHRAPEPARASGLAAETGFLPVDPYTLATKAEGIYAIGDVAAIPIAGGKMLPKAGVFAHGQADAVARRIVEELSGRAPTATFGGRGSCFLEMGNGVAAFATGDFYAAGAPEVKLRRPGRHWHLAKVALEQVWLRRWM